MERWRTFFAILISLWLPLVSCTRAGFSGHGATEAGVVDVAPGADADTTQGSTSDAGISTDTTPLHLEGLVAWYRFDDALTQEATDSSGNGLHASCTTPGCAVVEGGMIGTAYRFDGVDDVYRLDDVGAFDTGTFTIALWFRADRLHNAAPLSKVFGSDAVAENSWQFETSTAGEVSFTAGGYLWSTSLYQADTWHHLAATYDGTTKRLYFGGNLEASAPVPITFDDGPVVIGADINWGLSDFFFAGLLDDIRVYNRVLSDAEILSLSTSF